MSERVYEYNPIDESPVIVATAAQELATARAVLLTKDGAKLPTAGKEATGIAILENEKVAKGDDLQFRSRIRVCGPLVQRLMLDLFLLQMQRDYVRKQQQGSTF